LIDWIYLFSQSVDVEKMVIYLLALGLTNKKTARETLAEKQ